RSLSSHGSSLQNYLALLDKGSTVPEKELYVRLRAWWAGNDARRTEAGGAPMSPGELSNLAALALMLNESDDSDRVMKAEAMRELGRFDHALSLLAKPLDDQLAHVVKLVRSLAEANDPCVRKLRFE
ncbi:MAG: hypothetical protein ACOYOB_08845, partial [Myxococcota bacterium]